MNQREIVIQVILHFLVFIFYAFERDGIFFQEQKIVYFIQYALAANVINYFLLPRFYYKKKYVRFFINISIVVFTVIVFEELVLEQLYFPDDRAKQFPGLLFTLSQVLPVITILSGFKFAWDALGKQREVEMLKLAAQDSELQYLKSQINPHFLFNNLNNLYSYAIEKSPKTPEIILELSGILRYMLYECRDKYVALEKEVEHLRNFIKISEMQIEERGEVRFEANNIRMGFRVAPLILNVFVENAFKHSTASQSRDIFINVSVDLSENGTLAFLCQNTYNAQSNTQSMTRGIGLDNVRKRLQLIYPDAHDLRIMQAENKFEVRLDIDLTKSH